MREGIRPTGVRTLRSGVGVGCPSGTGDGRGSLCDLDLVVVLLWRRHGGGSLWSLGGSEVSLKGLGLGGVIGHKVD